MTSMQGLHLTADLQQCQCSGDLLTKEASLRALCQETVKDAGLTPVAEKFFTFPASGTQLGGVTGVVLLAESHLAIHTWPECAGVTLDVFVCNFTEDNSAKAELLMATLVQRFEPQKRAQHQLKRGL